MPIRGFVVAELVLCTCLLAPRPARACIPIPNASGLTAMEGRRAVVWIKETSFELVFQNQYAGNATDFAWIIPLPGVPTTVDQASADFLDKLDRYTAPMIEEQVCRIPCTRHPDAGASWNLPPPSITIWGSGKLGDLEYVVLSSTSSADLLAWLQARGFNLDPSLKVLIESYLGKGFTFFAAKVAAGAQKPASVPAVRFAFDRSKTPIVYPLRISAFNRQTALPTTIWVIAKDGTYLPTNYPTAKLAPAEHTKESLGKALEALRATNQGRTFVVEYAAQGSGSWKRHQLYYKYGSSSDAEMTQIFNESLFVVRLGASLNPFGTTEDLTLAKSATVEREDGWFKTPCPGGVIHDPCPDLGPQPRSDGGLPVGEGGAPKPAAQEGGCQLVPGAGAQALPLLGLLAACLLLALRRRRDL